MVIRRIERGTGAGGTEIPQKQRATPWTARNRRVSLDLDLPPDPLPRHSERPSQPRDTTRLPHHMKSTNNQCVTPGNLVSVGRRFWMHVSSWAGGPTDPSLLPLLRCLPTAPRRLASTHLCSTQSLRHRRKESRDRARHGEHSHHHSLHGICCCVELVLEGDREGRPIFVSEAVTIRRKEHVSRSSAQQQRVIQAPVVRVAFIRGGNESTLVFRAGLRSGHMRGGEI